MERPPRPTSEPIINRSMFASLILQMIFITGATLTAFRLGMDAFGTVEAARTMAFVCLSGCQLVRAYTNRSERASVFSIGVFSNKWMQIADLSSVALLLAVIYVPFINDVFNVVPLDLREWGCLLPLMLLPAVVDELAKLVSRRAGSGAAKGG
jgi:Ca2+-transporting ATPase